LGPIFLLSFIVFSYNNSLIKSHLIVCSSSVLLFRMFESVVPFYFFFVHYDSSFSRTFFARNTLLKMHLTIPSSKLLNFLLPIPLISQVNTWFLTIWIEIFLFYDSLLKSFLSMSFCSISTVPLDPLQKRFSTKPYLFTIFLMKCVTNKYSCTNKIFSSEGQGVIHLNFFFSLIVL
jgi:hypothetical protein